MLRTTWLGMILVRRLRKHRFFILAKESNLICEA